MSSFFNRITAFLLGIILTVTAVVGAGLFAYKQKFSSSTEKDGLEDYSVEELVDLLTLAIESPDDYTLARLEEEYGISLKDFLINNGVDLDKVDEGDWNALANISIFNIVNGIEPFLDGIKLRALYVILPQITGLELDEILSKEAQVKLGDYTLWELMNSDEINKELGLVSALKGLKFGSFLPSIFEAQYNEDKHEYIYTVKEGNGLGILNIFANVSMKGVMDIINGEDPLTEIMEGDLVAISHLKIVDILGDISTVGGSDFEDKLEPLLRVFGDATLGDLFTKKDDGYQITFDKLATEVEIGYLLGFEKKDGVWYKDDSCTEKIDGLLETVASLNLKDILDADGDTLKTIEAVAGDMSILTLYETFVDEKDIPLFISMLGNVTVSDILRNGEENIGATIIEMLDTYVGNMTLGEALNDVLTKDVKDKIQSNALTAALMDLRLGDFLKEEYSLETFLSALENAIGGITIGETLGYEKDENGKWICDNEVMALLLDITFSNIFDVLRADDAVGMTKALVGDMTIGEIYGAVFGFEKTQDDAIWHKGEAHVTKGFSEFLDLEIWKVVSTMQKGGDYNIYYDFEKLTLGDVVYGTILPLNMFTDKIVTDGEKVFVDGDLERATAPFFSITVKEFAEKGTDAFKETAKELLAGDILAPIVHRLDNFDVTAIYSNEEGKWIVQSSKIPTIYNNLFNIKLGDLLESFEHDNFAIWEEIVGDTYLYEIVNCFTDTWQNDCFLRCLYSAKVVDFVKLLGAQKTLDEVYGHIKLIECLGCYLPEEYLDDPVLEATFQATISDLVFLFTNDNPQLFREGFFKHYGELTIRDFMNTACLLGGVEGDPVDVLPVGKHLTNKLLDTKFNQFDDGIKNGLREIAQNVYAGDFFAEVLQKVLSKLDVNHSYVIHEDGTYTVNGRFSVLCNKLYNKTFYELYKSLNKEGIKNLAEEFLVGDFIAEIVAKAMDIAEISHSYTIGADGTYTVKGKFAQLLNKIYNKNGKELLEKADREGIKELLGEFLVGDFSADIAQKALSMFGMTSSYEINEDGTYDVDGRFSALQEKMYNKSLREILSKIRTKEGIKDLMGEFLVGDFSADIADKAFEILDVYSAFSINADGTYTVSGKFAQLLNKIYNKNGKELLESASKEGIKALAEDFLVGDFVADIVKKAFDVVDINHSYVINQDGTYTVSGNFDILCNKAYNKTIKELLDSLSKQGIKDLMGEFLVGDFAHEFAEKVMNRLDIDYAVNYDGKEYIVSGAFATLLTKVYNYSMYDLTEFRHMEKIKEFINVPFGEYLIDLIPTIKQKMPNLYNGEIVALEDGTYGATGSYYKFMTIVANMRLIDTLKGLKNEGKSYIFSQEMFGSLYYGDIMDGGLNSYDETLGVWYDKDGAPIDFGSVQDNAIQSRIYSVKLSSLVEGLNVTDIIGGAYLGEMLNYECDDTYVLGHVHNENCVWKKPTDVYVQGVGETTMLMPVDTLDRILAELSVEDVIKGKFNVKSLIGDCKLGDLFNLYEVEGVWYAYATEGGKRIVDGLGNFVAGTKSEELYQTLCPIKVSDIMANDGIDVIMDSIKTLELGYVLGYNLGQDGLWYDGETLVQGAMEKMCHHTMNELTGDIHNIVEEWTFGEVFDDETINSNPFFVHMQNYTIHEASEAINSMQIGEVMGYTRTGNNWYNEGVLVTDEILSILANYYIGNFTGAAGYELYDDNGDRIGFSDHIIQEMLENVSIGTIFADAGQDDADGFLSLVDPSWKLGDLSTSLIEKVKAESTIEELIKLGVFGDYFEVLEGETVASAQGANFVMMDAIFKTKTNASGFIADANQDGTVTDGEARAYWTGISMPKFMEELMLTINEYYARLQAYEAIYGPLQ